MKSIAFAQQIWLLADYVKKNPKVYEGLPKGLLFMVDEPTQIVIPRKPVTPNVIELEGFGLGPAWWQKKQVTLTATYHNDHDRRCVQIMRLENPVIKRGQEHYYATLFYTPYQMGFNAVRYSTNLFSALFKARPALTREVKYRPAGVEPYGETLVDFNVDALAICLDPAHPLDIESLILGGSLQDNIRA